MLARLERAGLIVATEKEQFVPGRNPEGMLLADILQAVRTSANRLLDRRYPSRRRRTAAEIMSEV